MENINENFLKMDQLALSGESFVFAIDFLKKHFIIRSRAEMEQHDDILVHFKHFKNYQPSFSTDKNPPLRLFPEDYAEYKKGFDRIKENLENGVLKLINYTRKTKIESDLTMEEIFKLSDAKYKILVRDQWVCFSPEPFVRIKDGKIKTFPMKGTIDADIPNARTALLNNPKEIREHQTAVKLLQQDLSVVAEEVKVKDFRKIEYLRTANKDLLTTSSEIEGTIKSEFKGRIGSILNELLPAGSILGDPRPESLKMILEAEGYKRGFYTGIVGYFDGKSLDSGVLIRFIEKEGNEFYFKSGGGITRKSSAKSEYEEVLNKIYVPIY